MKIDLVELQKRQLPRLQWKNLLSVKSEGSEPVLTGEEESALQKYFEHFLPPGPCIQCGAQQGCSQDDLISLLLGKAKFQWGIVHGEGFCSDCGYPARAYHRDIGPIKFLQCILQYHPEELKQEVPCPAPS